MAFLTAAATAACGTNYSACDKYQKYSAKWAIIFPERPLGEVVAKAGVCESLPPGNGLQMPSLPLKSQTLVPKELIGLEISVVSV